MKNSILVVAENALVVVNSCAGTIMRYLKEDTVEHIILLLSSEYKLLFTEQSEVSNVYIEEWNLKNHLSFLTRDTCERLACVIRTLRPDFIITHSKSNNDYDLTTQLTLASHAVASAAGVFCNGLPISSRRIPAFGAEPTICNTHRIIPDIFVDITLEEVEKQKIIHRLLLPNEQSRLKQRDALNGQYARKFGRETCKYAEAFSMYSPVCIHNSFVW